MVEESEEPGYFLSLRIVLMYIPWYVQNLHIWCRVYKDDLTLSKKGTVGLLVEAGLLVVNGVDDF